MIEGFKKFIARGNMIDMAVGVVMGGAVTTVVNSIVNNVINPFIAMIFGKPNMDGLLAITFNNATVFVRRGTWRDIEFPDYRGGRVFLHSRADQQIP